MAEFWIAVVLAVASGVCYGAGAAVQRLVAARLGRPLSVRVVLTVLLRDREWWWSLVLNGLGALLHVAALAFGALIVVQPLGLLALVFALPWAARLAARPVTGREWRGAVLTVVALSAMLVVAADTGDGAGLGSADTLPVLAASLALMAAAVGLSRTAAGAWRSGMLALAAGAGFGVSSALTKALLESVQDMGPAGLWHAAVPGIAVLGASGVLLSQAAYRGVTVGAPLAVMTMANPVAAVLVGVAFMGEGYLGGAWGAGVAVLTGMLALLGIYLLTVTVDDGPAEGRPRPRSETAKSPS